MLFYFPCAVETHIAVSENVLVNGHLDTRFTRYTTPCPPPFALRAPTHAAAINVGNQLQSGGAKRHWTGGAI